MHQNCDRPALQKKGAKRPFFLFEILIGLALLSGLLWLLFSFFSSSAKMDQKLEKASFALLERQTLIEELDVVLTSVIPPKEGSQKTTLYTQTMDEKISLALYFDHGIDPDPSFSGPCFAKVYLDEENTLNLAIWPEKREKDKTHVRVHNLLKNVEKLEFRFLKKTADGKIIWEKERDIEEKTAIPSMIYVDLWQGEMDLKEPPLTLPFFLPFQEPEIIYSKTKAAP